MSSPVTWRQDLVDEWRAALAIARKELRIATRYPLNLANEVLQPLYQFLLPSLLLGATFAVGGRALGLASLTGTEDLAGFLFLGVVVAGLVGAAFWEIAFSFKREMCLSVSLRLVLIVVGFVVFGASYSAGFLAALPAIALASLSMLGIGYLVASAVLMLREPTFFVDATSFLFATASGVAFPITVLPILVRPVAYLLPTTYALDLLRHFALGTRPLLDPWVEWLALAALALVTLALGRFVFLRTEHRMRIRGTLGQH
jgi:hypothetical protein